MIFQEKEKQIKEYLFNNKLIAIKTNKFFVLEDKLEKAISEKINEYQLNLYLLLFNFILGAVFFYKSEVSNLLIIFYILWVFIVIVFFYMNKKYLRISKLIKYKKNYNELKNIFNEKQITIYEYHINDFVFTLKNKLSEYNIFDSLIKNKSFIDNEIIFSENRLLIVSNLKKDNNEIYSCINLFKEPLSTSEESIDKTEKLLNEIRKEYLIINRYEEISIERVKNE